MCGPYVHVVVERPGRSLVIPISTMEATFRRRSISFLYNEALTELGFADIDVDVDTHMCYELQEMRYYVRVKPQLIRAGINIVTGEPETNEGTKLTEDEKDTLRWHFVTEYPTWRELWRKHIKPHYAKRDDGPEWEVTFMDMLTPEAYQRAVAFNTDSWKDSWTDKAKDRYVLARFLRMWRKPKNRIGYWAEKGHTAKKPKNPTSYKWDVNKNAHAELMS